MPMAFSTNHGGMTPDRGPRPVRFLIERAHGRTSSYVMRDMGAIEPERWHVWQCFCRIGAMSFVKVGLACATPVCADTAGHPIAASPPATRRKHRSADL